jgi:hypothetical protein
MEQADRDFLVLGALRRALYTMLLIDAGKIEVHGTDCVINLAADIRRLKTVVALMEGTGGTMQ